MNDTIGEYKLASYRKIKVLGEKNNLWLVEDTVKGKYFVLRELPVTSQKIYQELKQIKHPNIVEVKDVFHCYGYCYAVEEYLEWELLSDRIAGKSLSRIRAYSVAKQLFCALSALQEYNIVHRDIKPENIMIDSFGNVKLIDFDIARLFSEDKTKDTTLKGSRDYAPPEQFGFSQSDYRTDIYSLGVTINEIAVGELPEKKMCRGRLGAVVKHCTEFDPKRRFQTADQALRYIRRKSKSRVAGSVLVGVLFVVSLTVFFLFQKKELSPETLYKSAGEDERILSNRQPGSHPFVLLKDGETCEFTMDLGKQMTAEISAEQIEDNMDFSCKLQNGSTFEYKFEDVFEDWYKDLGYSINTDIENTSPEYEITQSDIDQDGIEEILIAFSRRFRRNTLIEDTSYYLTEYSIVWIVFPDEKNTVICSKPLGFEGCLPELETGGVFYEHLNAVWYFFDKENESWSVLY